MKIMIERLLGGISWLERLAIGVAMVMMFVVMAVVAADVFMRYVFNSPFSWAYDMISLYLMAGIFFLGLSQAYAAGAHVSVDILQQTFPKAGKRLSECLTCALALVAFGLMARLSLDRAIDAYASGDVIAGTIAWPTWPSIALVPFGAGLLCLRLAVHLIGNLASLLTGQDLIALPDHAHSVGEAVE